MHTKNFGDVLLKRRSLQQLIGNKSNGA